MPLLMGWMVNDTLQHQGKSLYTQLRLLSVWSRWRLYCHNKKIHQSRLKTVNIVNGVLVYGMAAIITIQQLAPYFLSHYAMSKGR